MGGKASRFKPLPPVRACTAPASCQSWTQQQEEVSSLRCLCCRKEAQVFMLDALLQ